MKIAFVVGAFPTVSETFILAQIVGLLQRGHEVDIYADRPVPRPPKVHADVGRFRLLERTQYREPMPGAKPARLKSAASRLIRRGWRHPVIALDSLNIFCHGRKALNLSLVHEWFPAQYFKWDYDVIHCHFGPNGERAILMRRAGAKEGPIITTFHGYDANLLPRIHGLKLYRTLFKHGDLFTVGSEFMRRRIVSLGAPKDRIVKLPMGVDISRYRFVERQKAEDGEFRLLTVARLVEVKGIEYALRAAAIVKTKCPRLRYKIAGDGSLRSKLEALAAELGLAQTVEFLGAVNQEDVLPLYEAAHGFVLPSIVTDSGEEESQSVVLAEAQASGLPVIATAIGGIPESIRDGKSGWLVQPQNPEALASAILRLANHPERWGQMGRAGRLHVEEHFNLERLNDQLVNLYCLVLNRTSQASASYRLKSGIS
jgi:colanic acid/amylovoran biosynthesis glycosyltransferase